MPTITFRRNRDFEGENSFGELVSPRTAYDVLVKGEETGYVAHRRCGSIWANPSEWYLSHKDGGQPVANGYSRQSVAEKVISPNLNLLNLT